MIDSFNNSDLSFVDVFAGCGGLSLGLASAGWTGRFAIEKNPDAFNTLATNLVSGKNNKKSFEWPRWLPQSAISTTNFLAEYSNELMALKGKVTLLSGGPPCQGFSLAGRRTQSDPRNALTDDYIEMVKLLEPRFLLVENVRGFTLPFKKNANAELNNTPYSEQVQERLEKIGYKVYSGLVDLSLYGVPQTRKRFIIIAIKSDDPALLKLDGKTPLEELELYRSEFLANKGLPQKLISVKDAIGDLETAGKTLISCSDSPQKGYQQVDYAIAKFRTPFIELMRNGLESAPNSLRLPRHAASTIRQFGEIMESCPKGRSISKSDRSRLNIKKHALTPLLHSLPSSTVTTLPDDIIHYSEPRILTARENARLQTFPDSFEFTGQYTTGGAGRKLSCPRYTQIGNAVPPLFAEAIGRLLRKLAS
ncbi:DNA cytosine methyltransferase [Pseudomonas lini]|uniref:DNA cytosine methyltransferase n=1 Tax=Pseudomonas lini TaxID=163011 RepID=UPI000F4B2CA0|nr:DNA cytosine methyltransferase [Pseudomonas lini]